MAIQFHLENFRSVRKASLPLAPLTLLIGANASGKSNALEALRLLSRIAQGQYLQDAFRTLQREGALRGRVDDLTYGDEPAFTLGYTPHKDARYSDFCITIKTLDQELVVAEEEMGYEESTFPYLYRVEHTSTKPSHQLSVAYNNLRRGRKPHIDCDDRQAVFTQLMTPARFTTTEAQELIPESTRSLRHVLDQMLFLDPIPQLMRDYSYIEDAELQGDGANLSSVLYHLCREDGQRKRVLDFVQALPEQDIRSIDFVETPRREVMVKLEESFGRHPQYREAALLSDGTLRVLAVAAAVLSAQSGALVVIEEIDNGVHPSRAELLLSNIAEAAESRDLHVLLTTHNPALMDALPMKAIPDVVYCYRDPDEGDSRLVRLRDLDTYSQLIAQGTVGKLIQQGIMEHYLKSERLLPDDRTDEALTWLESITAESPAR